MPWNSIEPLHFLWSSSNVPGLLSAAVCSVGFGVSVDDWDDAGGGWSGGGDNDMPPVVSFGPAAEILLPISTNVFES